MKQIPNALQMSHKFLLEAVGFGDKVIDGTMGNGNDTLFLAKLVGKNGKVYSFDIQKQAVKKTTELLLKNHISLENVNLINESHDKINEFLPTNENISAAIFNLGYLPGGDKAIITKPKSTIPAITSCIEHLIVHGIILVVLYYGHPGGEEEKDKVLGFAENLDQRIFNVFTYSAINEINEPPILLIIQKRK